MEATSVEVESMTGDTFETWVRMRVKDIHPKPPIPKMVIIISLVISPTVTEVGWDDQKGQGGGEGVD